MAILRPYCDLSVSKIGRDSHPAYPVSGQTSDDGTNESATRAERSDQLFLAAADLPVIEVCAQVDEHSRNNASVVSEEGAGNRCCRCDHPDEPGGGRLVDIVAIVIGHLYMVSDWKDHLNGGRVKRLLERVAAVLRIALRIDGLNGVATVERIVGDVAFVVLGRCDLGFEGLVCSVHVERSLLSRS